MTTSSIDIMSELSAVQAALSHARQQQSQLARQISETTDIVALSRLHDAWAQATEDLDLAEQRRAELVAALSQ